MDDERGGDDGDYGAGDPRGEAAEQEQDGERADTHRGRGGVDGVDVLGERLDLGDKLGGEREVGAVLGGDPEEVAQLGGGDGDGDAGGEPGDDRVGDELDHG